VAILAKTTNDLYPDLIALGGPENTLQSALREIGSALTVSELDKDLNLLKSDGWKRLNHAAALY
jgi:hypothetical protein